MNLRLEMGERGEREKGEGRGNLDKVRPQALGRGVGQSLTYVGLGNAERGTRQVQATPQGPAGSVGGGWVASRTQHGSVGASLRRISPEALELLSQTAWSSEVYKNA